MPIGSERALTHRSHRQNSESVDNERLEFLGDRVLGLVVSEHLFQFFPDWDAGKLSKGLAQLVSTSSIYAAAQRLDLGAHLRLGPGEEKTGGREKKRLLADAYEAIVGAIYLDAGLPAAAAFLRRTLIEPALLGERNDLIAPITNPRCRNGCSSALSAPPNTVSTRNPDPTIRKFSKWKSGIRAADSPPRKAAAKRKPSKLRPSRLCKP